MGANRTIIVWAIGLLAYAAPAVARDTGVGVPGYACAVSAPAAAAIAARQDSVAKRDGRIPGLGRVHGRVGWDNRKELTLVGDGFTLRRTLDPLIQAIEITLIVVVECAGSAGRAENSERKPQRLPPRQRRPACHRDAREGARRDGNADPELQERNGHAHRGQHCCISFRSLGEPCVSGTATARRDISS